VKNDSFRLFLASIKTEATKRVYTYSLHEFMKFTKIKNYDDIPKLKPKQIQKLLSNWILSLTDKGPTEAFFDKSWQLPDVELVE